MADMRPSHMMDVSPNVFVPVQTTEDPGKQEVQESMVSQCA